MQNLFNQFSQVLGITLLHSLWQGLIIYALLRLLFICFPSASSGSKYNITLFGLAGSVAWAMVTLFIEIGKHPIVQQTVNCPDNGLPFIPAHTAIPFINPVTLNSYSITIEQYMPYIVLLWLTGVLLNSARLIWGWRSLYQIRQTLTSSSALAKLIPALSQKLNIKKHVAVFVSEYIDVPCIIGYLKPVIILPVAITTQFTAAQIESILIHEMAHIRRNDYLINVLQQVVSIVFFFNPFTHLLNRIIYNERKHSCDDLVLNITGQPLIYAQTLLQLEETRSQNWQLALAATGKKYHLLNRIKRIMETKKQVNNIRHILVAVLLLIGSMGTIAWLNPEIKDGKVTVTPIKNFAALLPVADTAKKSPKAKKASKTTVKVVFPKPKPVKPSPIVFNSGNPVYDKLAQDVSLHATALQNYYSNAEYLELRKKIDACSAIIDSFENKPEIKKLEEKMDAQKAAAEAFGETPEMKELQKRINALSKSSSDFYDNPEYKRLQRNFDEQAKWFEKLDASKSPDFKAHSIALEKAGVELRKYTADPQRKANEQQLQEDSKKIREYYSSTEFVKLRDEISQTNKELRAIQQSPILKEQQEKLRLLGKQMWVFTERPDIKKEKALLNEARQRLIAYTNSPAYKKLQYEKEQNRKAMQSMRNYQPDTTNNGGK